MIALVLSAALAASGPASGADERMLSAELEARVQHLGKELRCATCQGLSIADSPAAMARSQLAMVRELVSQGKTDEEIKEYFVARYGEWVLLAPPVHGVSTLAWALPVLFIVGGFAIVVSLAMKGSKRRAAAPGAKAAPAGEGDEDDEYLAAVRREVDSR